MNKEILIFLGSGASVPFGLPSMREMVDRFEKILEKSNRTTNNETMIQLYGSIKKTILETYGYVDLESVFTVLLSNSQKKKYADLGYTFLFAVSKVIADPKLNIATETEVNTATKLLRIYKGFVRQACRLKESTEKKITNVYSDFFEQVGSKYASHKPLKGEDGQQYIYPYNSSIYTTNYDNVIETYWQGIAHINDLWKDTKGTLTLDVEKHEGDVPDLIKLHGSLDWLGLTDGTIIKLDKRRTTYAKRKVQGEFMLYPIQQKDLYLYPWFGLGIID